MMSFFSERVIRLIPLRLGIGIAFGAEREVRHYHSASERLPVDARGLRVHQSTFSPATYRERSKYDRT